MIIKKAEFISCTDNYFKCPPADKPEFAFIGRSNVGKSSLINMLTDHSKLAKVSSTPGKTQTINHFEINQNWYLVDLPGYGYARISQKEREKWSKMVWNYILKRENLTSMAVLIDSRIPPQKNDIEFINKLGTEGIPFFIVLTKCDKSGLQKTEENLNLFKKEMSESWSELPLFFKTSAENKSGKEEILNHISEIIKTLKKESLF
ncbi:MAG: ribosome biogenesis GTP-binding protein YihA/YsxC [Cytophagales bacterium]